MVWSTAVFNEHITQRWIGTCIMLRLSVGRSDISEVLHQIHNILSSAMLSIMSQRRISACMKAMKAMRDLV